VTKLASVPPFCASCFQAGSDKRYVDFDAAYDGPVLELPDGRKQTIDDLVICETCLAEAFRLLPQDDSAKDRRIAELEELVENMQADINSKDGTIQRFGITVDELIKHPIKRQAGYAEPAGVPDEVREFIKGRRKIRMKAPASASK
jgi:predicted Rdx family selenoprotein